MGLNLFKKTKRNKEKERILGLLEYSNELLYENPSLGACILDIAKKLYYYYNAYGRDYDAIPELKETLFRYLERQALEKEE